MIASLGDLRDMREQGDLRDARDPGDPRLPGDARDLGDPRDPGELYPPPPMLRSKGESRTRTVAYAAMTALLTIALLVAVSAIYQLYFRHPPVEVRSLDELPTKPLCAGMEFSLHNEIVVKEPVILFFYLSVMDATANYNVPGTQISLGPYPHPRPTSFKQIFPWVVPNLPPGNYTRVLAVRGTDGDQEAEFILTPFEIAEGC